MINHGPVDVVVLAAGEPRFDGGVLAELERQAASGTIRVLDAMILLKDEEGRCWGLDLEALPPEEAAALGFIETGTHGLFDSEDADTLYEGMVPGSAVVALAIEHTWALALVNALYQAGVDVALNFRVPAMVVDEAFASLESELVKESKMPGLMRGMVRTAAVVGTATATRGAVNRRQANKNAAAYTQAMESAAPPPQEVVYVEAPAAPAPEEDVITQLERLGALKAQGILTEEEFAAQKAKLLGM